VALRTVGLQGAACFSAEFFFGGIQPVDDGGVKAAHERHPAIPLLLYFDNVVLGQYALPDI
jgi:hypothetical protein